MQGVGEKVYASETTGGASIPNGSTSYLMAQADSPSHFSPLQTWRRGFCIRLGVRGSRASIPGLEQTPELLVFIFPVEKPKVMPTFLVLTAMEHTGVKD